MVLFSTKYTTTKNNIIFRHTHNLNLVAFNSLYRTPAEFEVGILIMVFTGTLSESVFTLVE